MKLNKVIRFLVIAFLITTAVLVPRPTAAASLQFDLCDWIKRVQAGEISWAKWDSSTRTITITDVVSADNAEAVALYQTVKSLQFKTDINLSGQRIWQAPSSWGGCGSDAGGNEWNQAPGPFGGRPQPTPITIAVFGGIAGIIGILLGLRRLGRTTS